MARQVSLLNRLIGAWRDIAGSPGGNESRPDLSGDGDVRRLRDDMQECLDGRGGEVSARARAAALGRRYLGLDETGRTRFLRILAGDFDVDRTAVDAAMEAVRSAPARDRPVAEANLRRVLEPQRTRLLTQFNDLPEGIKFLVDLRSDLLPLTGKDASLASLDDDLRRLLASWFDIGFLALRRIDWSSPAALLEKLIEYEAVHEIRGWNDLKNRLARDRRCFAYFHPRMPEEPLIFVEVALVNGLADNVVDLLDEHAPLVDPATADTAIFYSISNAQKGLVGISFGGFLIKRVVDQLRAELPNLKTFSTLSPIPGFRGWLDSRLRAGEPLPGEEQGEALRAILDAADAKDALGRALADSDWARKPAIVEALQPWLLQLCAHYLLREKGRGDRARDPVANFHLTNGARVERLNWMGDPSPRGMAQSFGLMVNYLYRLERIEEHHEAYTGGGKVSASSAVTRLLKA